MLNSKAIEILTPLFEIVRNAKGKTISQIKNGKQCNQNSKRYQSISTNYK